MNASAMPLSQRSEWNPMDAVTVVKVMASGKHPKTGRPSRFDVTFSTGEIASTFSETLQQLILEAHAQKAPVRFSTEPNEGYNDKLVTFSMVPDVVRMATAAKDGGDRPGCAERNRTDD